ncbi:MAG: hypothetical protein DRJ47_00755 [Thermoprotei archaeon]|nr:MAG: hypothetical protein DRJ47_00755 [Thermoprotei archaeon]
MGEKEEIKKKEKEKEVEFVSEDVMELRGVLSAVSEFLKDLGPMVKEILDTVLSAIDGAKLGEETGAFYKQLIEAGMDPEHAKRLTEKFLEKKLSFMDLSSLISEAIKGGKKIKVLKKLKREGEEEEEEEKEED